MCSKYGTAYGFYMQHISSMWEVCLQCIKDYDGQKYMDFCYSATAACWAFTNVKKRKSWNMHKCVYLNVYVYMYTFMHIQDNWSL